jgi:hypothetical protein
MATYRVYWIDRSGRIRRGAWLEAADDEDAHRQASELCDEVSDTVQVWQAARPVDEIECNEPADRPA